MGNWNQNDFFAVLNRCREVDMTSHYLLMFWVRPTAKLSKNFGLFTCWCWCELLALNFGSCTEGKVWPRNITSPRYETHILLFNKPTPFRQPQGHSIRNFEIQHYKRNLQTDGKVALLCWKPQIFYNPHRARTHGLSLCKQLKLCVVQIFLPKNERFWCCSFSRPTPNFFVQARRQFRFLYFADNVYEYPAIAKPESLTPPDGASWKFEERFPPPPIFPPPPPSWRGDANALLREAIWANMVDQIKRAIKVHVHLLHWFSITCRLSFSSASQQKINSDKTSTCSPLPPNIIRFVSVLLGN